MSVLLGIRNLTALLVITCRNMFTATRLGAIEGDQEKTNDIIFSKAAKERKEILFFFGGDVQDYEDKMVSHRDNHRYQEWSLEATASILSAKYPTSDIIVIKSAKMDIGTFSVYSNFVPFENMNMPCHAVGLRSWNHLYKLFVNVYKSKRVLDQCPTPISDATSVEDNSQISKVLNIPKHIIGFSKGCVVLNQLVYDLSERHRDEDKTVSNNKEETCKENSASADGEHEKDTTHGQCDAQSSSSSDDLNLITQFQDTITQMTWLDGGHAGGTNTWVKNPSILKAAFGDSKIRINCHVTPYQIQDHIRPWIGKEFRKFVDILRRSGIKISTVTHFANEPGSIENHFEVLKCHHTVGK